MTPQENYRQCAEHSESIIVSKHADLVRRIAFHVCARLPASVDVEDLVQAGMIGLIEASRKFDSSQGASFETYAAIRIRGAMIDEIRRVDWMPRSVHRKSREVLAAIRSIEQREGRPAAAVEVAAAVGLTLDQYVALLNDAARGRVTSLEADLGETGDEVIAGHIPSPLRRMESSAFRAQLAQAISKLPDREKLSLSLYYEQELNLREIGQVLGVSESRVCQIHGQAMLRLRASLAEWQGDPVDELLVES